MIIRDAIIECFCAINADRLTVQQVDAWIQCRYPHKWKDISTSLADLTINGNKTSAYKEIDKCLIREGRGIYRLDESQLSQQMRASVPVSESSGERNTTVSKNQERRTYFIQGNSRSIVEAWADFRLPFEPKDDRLSYRNNLRMAMDALESDKCGFVEAEYVAASLPSNCDVENVLIYNVGPAAFSRIASKGLSFSYRAGVPELTPAGRQFEHYVRYRIADPESASVPGLTVVTLTDIVLSTQSVTSSAFQIWKAISLHVDSLAQTGTLDLSDDFFGVDIEFRIPSSTRISPAGIIKPLLDGSVASLHSVDEVDRDVVKKIASDVGESSDTVRRWLRMSCGAIVSRRSPAECYREGVRWHPDDSRLRWGRIELRSHASHRILMDLTIRNLCDV